MTTQHEITGRTVTLDGVHHIKLPVAQVARSRDWYERVLGMQVEIEFVEDGALMGVALRDTSGSVRLALRLDPDRAAALRGFDPVALAVGTRADLEAWAAHLYREGQTHTGVVTGHQGWALTGLHDPDGVEIRLYTVERHDGGAS